MDTPEQGTVAALSLATQAAELLEAHGDRAGSIRLQHTIAVIREDARYPVAAGQEVPVFLMRMALALLDRDGGGSDTAIWLQRAVDTARGAKPLRRGEEVDPGLLLPFDPDFPGARSG